MIRTFRSRLGAVSTGLLLAAATLGSLAPAVQAETASADVPATITASPTTGLSSGSTVTVSATAATNWNIYSLRARLCKSSATIDNAGDFSPTLGGNCIATALSPSTDSDVTVTTTAGNRGSASLDFKVGAGTETFTTQYDGDTTIACGTTSITGCKLVVEMSANNLNGRVIYKSFPLTYALPNAPTGVSAVWGNTKAAVSWTASASQTGLPAVTSYTVTSSPGGFACTTATTSCEVSGLTNGTAYTFTVSGTSALGNSSASSASAAVTPSASHYVLSSTPTTGLTSGDTVAQSVSMSNGYSLYSVRTRLCLASATISNAGDFSPTLGGNCIASALAVDTDKDVIVNTTSSNRGSAALNFKVGAGSNTFTTQYDGDVTIACGTPATATSCALVTELSYTTPLNAAKVVYVSTPITIVSVPAAPTSLNATPGNASASIAFTAGANGGSAITKYQYSINAGTNWTDINDSTSPVGITGLTNGTTYSVLLRAVNAVGSGASSDAVSVTPVTTPAAPTALVATAGSASASIAFTAGSDGGSAITKYQYSTNNGTTWADTDAGISSPVTISGLTNGTAYSIKLRAVNAAGNGTASSPAVSVTPTTAAYVLSSTPTTGLVSGDTVAQSVSMSNGFKLYSVRTRLCLASATISNAGDFSPTLGGNCIASALAVGTDKDVTVNTTSSNRGSAALNFKVGAGSNTFTTQYDGDVTIACGTPATGSSCALVTELSYTTALNAAKVVYVSTPITFTTAPAAPTSLNATPGNGSASIAFTAGANGGAEIMNYEYSLNGGSSWLAFPEMVMSSPVTVPGLTNGTSYEIKLRALNSVGNGTASAAVSVTPVTTPAAPTALLATPGVGSASIAFTAGSTGGSAITKYQYSTDGGTNWSDVASGTSSPVTITGLAKGQTFSIKLRAVSAAGNGAASTATSVSIAATVPNAPAAPTVVVAAAGGAGTASWTAPSNGGSAITGYEVTATGGATPIVKSITNPATLSQAFTGLSKTTTYTFTVKAINAIGNSVASAGTSKLPVTVPGKPATTLLGSTGNGSITVTYTAPTIDGGSAVTGYVVQAFAPLATEPTDTCESNASALTCTLIGLTNGVKYEVRVFAKNVVGTGVSFNKVKNVVPATTPGKATITTVTAGAGQVTVAWTAPLSNGGSAVTGYTVQAFNAAGTLAIDSKTCSPATATGTNCIVTGLTNGTAYTFKVTAANVKGSGSASNLSATATPAAAPAAPGSPLATANTGKSATITWTVPASNGSAITGYTVQAYTWNGTVESIVTSKKCTIASGSTTTCTISALTVGTQYKFTITATNAKGTSTAATTAAVTAKN